MALVMAIVLFLHIAVSDMATLKFDPATFLAWNKVLLRGVTTTIPKYWCAVDMA
jgi:hypothetical protein